jgi:hypothetical protein
MCLVSPLYLLFTHPFSFSFGFAKFYDVLDSEACIRGFFRLGYEVGFARVKLNHPNHPIYHSVFEPCDHSIPKLSKAFCCHKHAMMAMPNAASCDPLNTNMSAPQESFNSRLKAEGDDESTNLYISNLPRQFSEAVSHRQLLRGTTL